MDTETQETENLQIRNSEFAFKHEDNKELLTVIKEKLTQDERMLNNINNEKRKKNIIITGLKEDTSLSRETERCQACPN